MARHGALELQEVKLVLAELLLGLGQLALGDGELAVAVLEDGVGAAEQGELGILVLGAAVHLGGQLAALHLELGKVVLSGIEALDECRALDRRHVRGVLGGLLLRAEIEHGLLGILHALTEEIAEGAALVELHAALLERGATCVCGLAEGVHPAVELGEHRTEQAELVAVLGQRQMAQAETEAFVAHGLRGLALQRADLAGDLGHDIGHAREILLRERELVHRLATLALVFGDAGGLLEHHAALLGLG